MNDVTAKSIGALRNEVAELRAFCEDLEKKLRRKQVPVSLSTTSDDEFEIIASVVCDVFGVTIKALRGPRQHRDAARARAAFMWLAWNLTGASSAQVGHFLNRDHSTVIYGSHRASHLRESDDEFRAKLDNASALSNKAINKGTDNG